MDNIAIAKRWLEKAIKNNIDEVMDRFFSLYVAYNALYSRLSIKQGDDRRSATTRMAVYLKIEKISVLNNCESEIFEIIKLIEDDVFYIYGNESKQPHKQDSYIIAKIKEDINNYGAILNLIYGMRNNMFHGEKQIIAEQINLLNPANYILEKLVRELIKKEEEI